MPETVCITLVLSPIIISRRIIYYVCILCLYNSLCPTSGHGCCLLLMRPTSGRVVEKFVCGSSGGFKYPCVGLGLVYMPGESGTNTRLAYSIE